MAEAARLEAVDLPDEDSLTSLEDRVHRIVDVVDRLRGERDAALAELNAVRNTAASSVADTQKLRQEVESLRAERKLVRVRIEKLLSQIETLSTT